MHLWRQYFSQPPAEHEALVVRQHDREPRVLVTGVRRVTNAAEFEEGPGVVSERATATTRAAPTPMCCTRRAYDRRV
jgi:hypothetical protein